MARLVPLAALLPLLAACDDPAQPPPAAVAAAPATAPAQPAPVRIASDDTGAAAGVLSNDPSAPANTPLCGAAAQENNALTRQLLSRQYAGAGQCSAYACYDAATATFIGADGFRHVCR